MKAGELVTVDVTEQDIQSGQRADPSSCPVAKALKRATGNNYWFVDCSAASLDGQVIPLPPKVVSWIDSYDFGEKIKPISFALALRADVEPSLPIFDTAGVQPTATLELEPLKEPHLVS